MGSKHIDLTGQIFNKLTVIKRVPNDKYGGATWLCHCICGNYKPVPAGNLKRGHIKSCGCGMNKTHGHSGATPEYRIWQSIKYRCNVPTSKDYKNYGGRGIVICKEWEHDFVSFYNYVGKRPSKIHSIDRYPNKNGNYEPGNVRWATPRQQAQNVRNNVVLTHDGKTMVLMEWARTLGIGQDNIRYHLGQGRTLTQIVNFYELKASTGTIWMKWQ